MLVAERRSRIVAEVQREGAVSVVDLASGLGVSAMTVRRDLEHLANTGVLDKVRGGATVCRSEADEPERGFATRTLRRIPEKHAIARRAAQLVRPGMAVGLSGGTTVWILARLLRDVPDLTVVTNSLPVAEVFRRPDRSDEPYTQSVVLTGGTRTPSDALVGPVAVRSLEHLHLDVTFLGARGVDLHAGLTTSNLLEAETNRALVAAGRTSVVLADHSKWGVVRLTTIIGLDAVGHLVIDDGIPPEDRDAIGARVGELSVVPVDEMPVDELPVDELPVDELVG